MSILSVRNLTKTFTTKRWFKPNESFTAVNDISFDLAQGEILGILGANGAGKTTTIQMLLGLLTPTAGNINYFGKDLATHRSEIMQDVTFASAYLKLPQALTVYEVLNFYGKIYSMPADMRHEQIEKNLKFFEIESLRDKKTRTLSAGQLSRLTLAKAFLPKPKIVLLDEPTAALDPDIAIVVRKFVAEERKRSGTAIILTSHNMAEVEELCDRAIVFKQGKIIASAKPDVLTATIKFSHVHLLVTDIAKAIMFAETTGYPFKIEGNFLDFEVAEQRIPELLNNVMQAGIQYTEISIEKPTLEDYFLSIAAGNIGAQ